MNLKVTFVIAFVLISTTGLFAQTSKKHELVFHPMTDIVLLKGDTIRIETLRFYISSIELMKNDSVVWKEKNSFHLLDISVQQSLTVALNMASNIFYNRIKFNVGIDSITNVSGAMGGDLDPTRGMYWTWQSGYVNFKLEGKSRLCNTANNEFHFHLGGYSAPFATVQTVILKANETGRTTVVLDLKQFLSKIDLSKLNQVMAPGSDAVKLSKKLASAFKEEKK